VPPPGIDVNDIVNMAALSVLKAHRFPIRDQKAKG